MDALLVALMGLIALLTAGALTFGVILVIAFLRATARCPKCARPWALKPTPELLKAVTRRTLVREAGSLNVSAGDKKVAVPLSDFEVLYRCSHCGYEEVRSKLDVEATP